MNRAKLYIKGMRDEPIDLTEEQGREAEKIIAKEGEYKSLKDTDTVTIGTYTGPRGDLRYVKLIIDAEQKEWIPLEKRYSQDELDAVAKAVEPYLIQANDEDYMRSLQFVIRDIKDPSIKPLWPQQMIKDILAVREMKLNAEDEIETQARKICNKYILGKLGRKGEEKFFRSRRLINVDSFGNWKPIRSTIEQYMEAVDKINAYRARDDKREYAQRQHLEQLDELAQSMALQNNQYYDVGDEA